MKSTIRQCAILAVIVFIVLSFVLVLTTPQAFGQDKQHPRVYTEGGDTAVAYDSTCTWKEFMTALKSEFVPLAKKADYIMRNGQKIPGCYVELDGNLLMVFADGDTYAIPAEVFIRRSVPAKGAKELRI